MLRVSVAALRSLVCCTVALALGTCAGAANTDDSETAYTQDISKRADKIVATLELADDAQKSRVRDLIAQQYRQLRDIHGARDSRISEVKKGSADQAVAEGWVKVARDTASLKLIEAHRRFVARLWVELNPEQVDKVKDGLTYGVATITYKRYLEMFPELNDEQKREILADLLEAREYAMDGGSSEEKHAVFGKYKGRINNYLSKSGYDMKQAEKNLSDGQKAASQKK